MQNYLRNDSWFTLLACVWVCVCMCLCVGILPADNNNYSTNSGAPEYVQPGFLII